MTAVSLHRIYQGVENAPPPPLAGALAAWLTHGGASVHVVDPRGGPEDWSRPGPVWLHLEQGVLERCRDKITGADDLRFFGPCAAEAHALFPGATIIPGDPEGVDVDPESLPITTYAGFGPQPGGAFRILAGRYGRARPLPTLLREIVYLVETFEAGHLLFDDEDLGQYESLIPRFENELLHLPWEITWEGIRAGRRIRCSRGSATARL
ncbi:MAG: hypothetical protein VX498_00425 [Myxococcota bacterium]|nr:hypothetical protein [Myxococcota bacterium]